jgi:NitT/TauT family transport system substrate-binding protein
MRIGLVAKVVAVITLLAVVAVPAGPVAAQAAPTPVTLRVDVFFYGSHVPLLAGIVNGIYKKHGLDVTALEGRGSATTIQTVANMSDQFGFADGGTLVKLAAQGVQVKTIVGMLERSPMVVFTLPSSGITQPKQLTGKTGGFSPGSAPEQIFPAFAKRNGIDLASIKQVSVDIPTRDSIFLLKKTDFSFGYTVTQLPILEERCKCTLNVMKYSDYGLNVISNGIITSDKLIAQNPALVKAFAQATVESINAAIKDPAEAVDAFFKYATKSQLSHAVVARQWSETIKILHTDATAKAPVGVMAESDWQKSIELLTEYGGVPKGAVAPAMVFTNKFLEQ